ncbi:hypothetical protein FTUN_8250 [Frigoriglobus tundricola]|uniref:Uncharacterized protein n=1 Tax=Frigoriglobus tundricola TaxID=2774151 RepID=A0A6M5Z2I6_9BACT|nr:hypothetical protein FTUN_8250 [Frigoriglobus tundricola]
MVVPTRFAVRNAGKASQSGSEPERDRAGVVQKPARTVQNARSNHANVDPKEGTA